MKLIFPLNLNIAFKKIEPNKLKAKEVKDIHHLHI